MSRMIRKQVYLEPAQDELLKRRARERGVTEAHVLREAIAGPGYATRTSQTGTDPEAAKKLLAFIRSLPARSHRRGSLRWSREALYDERIARWPKS
jgi:hypothetical protein